MRTCTVTVGILVLMLALFAGTSFSDTRTINIKVSPHVIAMNSKATWVTVHADISYRSVDTTEKVTLNGLAASLTFADDRGDLVAKFKMGLVKDMISPPRVIFTLEGQDKTGNTFEGTETIRVVSKG